MYDLIDLILQGCVIRFIPIPQAKYCYPRRKIQIFLTVRIIETDTLPSFKNHRKAVIRMQHIMIRHFHIINHFHYKISPHHLSESPFQFLYL